MEFFIESNSVLNEVTDPNTLADRMPGMRESLDAVVDLRKFYSETDQLTTMSRAGWKHVASIKGPALAVAEILDPELLRDKRRAYAWLDRHPEYLTYDRRAALAKRPFHGWSPEEEQCLESSSNAPRILDAPATA